MKLERDYKTLEFQLLQKNNAIKSLELNRAKSSSQSPDRERVLSTMSQKRQFKETFETKTLINRALNLEQKLENKLNREQQKNKDMKFSSKNSNHSKSPSI